MKTVFTICILLVYISVTTAQNIRRTDLYIVHDKNGKAIKAYTHAEDCIHFMEGKQNMNLSNQYIQLHYRLDTATKWKPTEQMIIDDLLQPEPLDDRYLARDSVYIVIQPHFFLADRAYTHLDDLLAYTDGKQTHTRIPLYYRDKRCYDRVNLIRKTRLDNLNKATQRRGY